MPPRLIHLHQCHLPLIVYEHNDVEFDLNGHDFLVLGYASVFGGSLTVENGGFLVDLGLEVEGGELVNKGALMLGMGSRNKVHNQGRVIQQRIQNPLAMEILRRQFVEGSRVEVDYRGGEFTFERAE